MKKIVITGVSSGIGFSTAKRLVQNGNLVFGSLRNKKDAKKIKQELGKNFEPIILDVTDIDSINKAVSLVAQKVGGDGIDALINNSGIAKGGPILELDIEVFKDQFEVNFFGLINITKAFSHLLGAYKDAPKRGKIIMISSVAGKRSYPFIGPYSASKHALEGLSDSLRRELILYGIDVVLILPGPVKTEIWKKTPDPNNNIFLGSDYEPALRKFYKKIQFFEAKGLNPNIIAKQIERVLFLKKPRTRYVLSPNKLRDYYLPKLISDRLFDKLLSIYFGLDRNR